MRLKTLLILNLVTCACEPALERQPKLKPQVQNSSRRPVAGTYAYEAVKKNSMPINVELLRQGKNLYDIQCSICHGWSGHGDGMAVQRGYPAPVALQNPSISLQSAFQAISDGKKPMPPFAAKLSPSERWAVVYYIQVLQLREHFPKQDLTADDLKHLEVSSP